MSSVVKLAFCPQCRKEITEKTSAWPFCSETCRDADLFNWLSEDYVISRDLTEEEWDELIQKRFDKLDPYDPNAF